MALRQNLRVIKTKPRVFVVSDISNEPDDAESLVRLLLYANEFDTRGLVACTSTWMKRTVHPEDMRKILAAYAKVVHNLNRHVHPDNQYPSAEQLTSLVATGPALYGKEALMKDSLLSEGAKMLIDRLDESDDPLWILCWGGTNVVAQAVQYVDQSRGSIEAVTFRKKMRIYAISDQDDTGVWLRITYPDIFYINSIHGWNQYGLSTWVGISGDKYYGFDKGGPEFEKVSKEWIAQNIQIGPLGTAYPDFMFIPEGDTPTFLYLIQNGLGSPEHPDWGSWGGRYISTDLEHASMHYTDTTDQVVGKNGAEFKTNQATIWRWRDAFQNDFAGRMQWTIQSETSKANHHPVVSVNGSSFGPEPLFVTAVAGSQIRLDASASYDPDGDEVTFEWFHYRDITATQWSVQHEVRHLDFVDLDEHHSGKQVVVTLPPAEECAIDKFSGEALQIGQTFHFILTVKDNGTPPLVTYKRVVVQITNPEMRGGRGHSVESVADLHRL